MFVNAIITVIDTGKDHQNVLNNAHDMLLTV